MKKICRLFIGMCLVFGIWGTAGAATLTFDDIGGPGAFDVVPAGYGGLDWNNMWYADTFGFGDGFEIGTVSGNFSAFNGYGMLTTVSSLTPFTFNSAWLTGGYNDGLLVTAIGYSAGIQTYAKTVTVSALQAGYFLFDFLNIDTLTFTSDGGVPVHISTGSGTHFVMDDFRYNEAPTPAPVPIPAAAWLLGSGLAALGIIRRKLLV